MELLVGTDIESIERFQKLMHKKKVLRNIFFDSEYNYAFNKSNPVQTLTGIWCAKEAVIKSFSQIKLLTTKEVEIICNTNQAPEVIINSSIEKSLNYDLVISISHTKDFATAIALLSLYQ
jgi:holo-[acyl-carrier protein] synthase